MLLPDESAAVCQVHKTQYFCHAFVNGGNLSGAPVFFAGRLMGRTLQSGDHAMAAVFGPGLSVEFR
jgi:predicted naringenin-chalcone synthase